MINNNKQIVNYLLMTLTVFRKAIKKTKLCKCESNFKKY